MAGSVSIISEAIHSGIDLMAALIALFSVRTSGKPADEDHPFGHGKIENLSGTVEALLIFIAAAWIIYEAVQKFIHPEPVEMAALGVGSFCSRRDEFGVSQMLFRVGREPIHRPAADGWHLRPMSIHRRVMSAYALSGLDSVFSRYDITGSTRFAPWPSALLIIKRLMI
jgi:divalent metal cation (Fe/Co/Zn/Cd) transporter